MRIREGFPQSSPGRRCGKLPIRESDLLSGVAPTGSVPDIKSRQASRCYELAGQTRDVLRKILEQRDALCFQDEFSGIVRITEDYYKHLGEAKPCLPTHY